jgi:C4-dicarboxylate-specific signal transduction histidine kinase
LLASGALREAQTALAHVNRVATMGQLAASIAHEIKQPLAGAITNAEAGLGWLARHPPNVEKACNSLCYIIEDGNRASEVIERIRALMTNAPPRKDRLEINEAILEVIALTRGEVVKNGVSVQTQLAEHLPFIQADRVQLQQVILNLIINAVQAMRDVSEGSRELLIGTAEDGSNGVLGRHPRIAPIRSVAPGRADCEQSALCDHRSP